MSCDQAALWMVFSVRLSVCPPATPFFTMFPSSYHHERVITNDQSEIHAKGQGQRSKVKVTEVKTQLKRFWTVTPVWTHTCGWNDAQGLTLLRRGALLFLKVIRQISRSHDQKKTSSILTQIGGFRTVTLVWIHQWLRMMYKIWSRIEEVPYCFWWSSVKFQGHTGQQNRRFWPELSVSGL